MTLRDQVWNEALRQLTETGKFKMSDLSFEESKRHTVRRVLKQMEQQGWLSRESKHASIWRLGDTAESCLAVSENVKKAAAVA